MYPHYHFYCDESGQFEEDQYYRQNLVFGLLVPDEQKEDLALRYSLLKLKHNLKTRTFIHGKDLYRDKDYQNFIKDLVSLSCESSMKMVCIRYDRDILRDVAGDVSEALSCNRYLYMIQSLIETLLFLHPPLWNPVTDFSFKHNTRVFPVKNKEVVDNLKSLGYFMLQDKKDPGKQLVNVWDTAGFMIFLKRRLADFSPYIRTTGVKSIKEAVMLSAGNNKDPFVHWADNLAGVLLWKDNKPLYQMIKENLEIDAEYGGQHSMYQHLSMTFLERRFDEFLTKTMKEIARFQNPYYTEQLATMVDMAFDHMDVNSIQLENLTALVRDLVENSSGQWNMVLKITEKLIDKFEREGINARASLTPRTLQAARLSCLNHRGDVTAAEALAEKIANEPSVTVDDLRDKAEIKNRLAVTGANRFDFIEPAKSLIPYIKRLNNSRRELSKAEGHELKDPLIGRIASTAGQAFAFAAPGCLKHFATAEKILTSAARECVTPEDTLRQRIYLAHLYLDMDRLFIHSVLKKDDQRKKEGRFDKASEMIHLIVETPTVRSFIKNPSGEVSMAMVYVLSLVLKHQLQTGEEILPDAQIWIEKNLKRSFHHCMNEHPFELIWSYMGQLAFKNGDVEKADAYFHKALTIPFRIKETTPVIQAIHCQIIGIWAKALVVSRKNDEALEKIKVLVHIMNRLAENPENRTIISADGGGWFGAEIKNLEKALTAQAEVNKALSDFLGRFTFNYR